MIQILHIPGIQYEGETREQAEERDRLTIDTNRKLKEEWEEGERQRVAPMKSMQQWARDRGILHNAQGLATQEGANSPQTD